MGTSSQDGGIGKHGSPSCTTTAKITTKLQNNYHPESSENRAVWEPDNQGINEVTLFQIGRRGGDVETGNGRSHTQVWWIKIEMDTSGVRDPSPTPNHSGQGSRVRKMSPHNFRL